MKNYQNIDLLKIFLICLAGHIIILPIFSLVLPEKVIKPKYHMVYLYKESGAREVDIQEKIKTPQLPSTQNLKQQKIKIPLKEYGKLKKEFSIGITRTPLLTMEEKENIQWQMPDIEVPRYQFQISNTTQEGKTEEHGVIKGESFEIYGPAGTREIISKVLPEYPSWAEQQSIEANVKVKIWVNKEGIVYSTQIMETSGYRKLDLAAEETLKKWQFSKIDRDINVWAIVTMKFRLK